MKHRVIALSVLLAWSFVVVGLFHNRAVAPELRHTRVAEGNISKAVHLQWREGISGFAALVRSDARQWGRIRPMHWIYSHAPFFLTMIRNGDLWHSDPDVPRRDRINGDLQTYTYFQLAIVGLALAIFGVIVWRATGMGWTAFLVAPLAAGSPGLLENILVNYCDSVEIGQLLFIALYLLIIAGTLAGTVPGPGKETASMIALLLAYAMKETTIVLLPAVVFVLGLRYILSPPCSTAFKRFVTRHLAMHVAVAGIMVFFVLLNRSGAYAAHYQPPSGQGLAALLRRWWGLMGAPTEIAAFLAVAAVMVAVMVVLDRRSGNRWSRGDARIIALSLLFIALAAGFFAVNVPWGVPLRKYTLPTYWFMMLTVPPLMAFTIGWLRRRRLKPAALLWAVGSLVFITQTLPGYRNAAKQFYRNQYGYREAVPMVAADAAELANRHDGLLRIHLVGGLLYQEGALPFIRMMNRAHQLNIAENGKTVSSVRSVERNYLRRYTGAPVVEISLSVTLPRETEADYLYMLVERDDAMDNRLEADGFAIEKEWQSARSRFVRYVKDGEP